MGKYKACGYDIERMHDRMLEMAIEIDRICREQNIKYALYGGTLIGAIRHNGFIPWDRDLDIAMPRKDYERFRKYCKNNPSMKFFFSNYKSERFYPYNWGKLRQNDTLFAERDLKDLKIHHGVFVDVHPIDNIFPLFLKPQVKLTMFFYCVHRTKSGIYHGKTYKKKIYKMFSWLPFVMINHLRDFSMRMFNLFPTTYVYKIAHPNNGIYPIPRETFEVLIEHKFENRNFFIPANYDEFLKKRYGNYMEYPPEAEISECAGSIVECKL